MFENFWQRNEEIPYKKLRLWLQVAGRESRE